MEKKLKCHTKQGTMDRQNFILNMWSGVFLITLELTDEWVKDFVSNVPCPWMFLFLVTTWTLTGWSQLSMVAYKCACLSYPWHCCSTGALHGHCHHLPMPYSKGEHHRNSSCTIRKNYKVITNKIPNKLYPYHKENSEFIFDIGDWTHQWCCSRSLAWLCPLPQTK